MRRSLRITAFRPSRRLLRSPSECHGELTPWSRSASTST
uniref:Uncharacterized protein n=1 Tax=Aegilops tauschii subsp. strangulata TaxID=200361 RepID=A0A453E111_AEGTS